MKSFNAKLAGTLSGCPPKSGGFAVRIEHELSCVNHVLWCFIDHHYYHCMLRGVGEYEMHISSLFYKFGPDHPC